ncbi:MAG: hypothetical protein MR296_03640 [Tenericutes bacterium]|nr:hypothetical protein [Mycoplasmatota bacterium]
MEEKKIKVIINKKTIELESNNPDLKALIDLILSQNDDYDFNNIEIKAEDEKFDKQGFKEILIESISEFKNKLELLEMKKKTDAQTIEKLIKEIEKKMNS